MLAFKQNGTWRVELSKYGDDIVISKPNISINNLVVGTMYLDIDGTLRAINKTTGDTLEIEFTKRGWTSSSSLSGKCMDKNGRVVYKIEGSWLDKVTIKDQIDGGSEVIWTDQNLAYSPDKGKMYAFSNFALQLNHLPEDVQLTTERTTLIAPTDSRFRSDMRNYEEGKTQVAEAEKKRLEELQRKHRREREEAKEIFEPNFFEKTIVPNHWTGDEEIRYTLKTGEQGYWERRKRLDWAGLPDIFDLEEQGLVARHTMTQQQENQPEVK